VTQKKLREQFEKAKQAVQVDRPEGWYLLGKYFIKCALTEGYVPKERDKLTQAEMMRRAPANLSIAGWLQFALKAAEEAGKQGKEAAISAYEANLPPLDCGPNVMAYIACVAQGAKLKLLEPANVKLHMYIAQTILSGLSKQEARQPGRPRKELP
jgi:hypothetical protein